MTKSIAWLSAVIALWLAVICHSWQYGGFGFFWLLLVGLLGGAVSERRVKENQ